MVTRSPPFFLKQYFKLVLSSKISNIPNLPCYFRLKNVFVSVLTTGSVPFVPTICSTGQVLCALGLCFISPLPLSYSNASSPCLPPLTTPIGSVSLGPGPKTPSSVCLWDCSPLLWGALYCNFSLLIPLGTMFISAFSALGEPGLCQVQNRY